ncbi:MAG: HAD-IA family hydrolase [Clostridiales Family XIII bacterium]|jgi:pyrophosphatase PpaX|nr:HAD-IA family hydrolase [Clostridiales Family XIII bacterium]
MKKTTVIFDFDGTIMNTNEVIIRSWQHAFRTIEGKERPLEGILKSFGEPLDVSMARLFPNMPLEDAIEVYRSYHRDNFGEAISVFPGMRELLESLKGDGYAVALVTSRLRDTTWQGLDKYGLAPFFDTVVTCEDTAAHKPDPAPLLKALANMGRAPEEAVMVGDTMADVRSARRGGVASVLVGWAAAVTEEEKSGPEAPDFIIDKAEDLYGVLG